MGKCYFENLPKYEVRKKDGTQIKIDWKKSTGYLIPFEFKNVVGEFKVVDYDSKTQKVALKYGEQIHHIATSQLLACRLGGVLGVHKRDYIYKENQILDKNGQGKILERFRKGKGNTRHYLIECLRCHNTYDRSEGHLKDRGVKCPVCGDGISYPTKFMDAMLLQLNHPFKKEYIFENIKNKRYDFYIEDINTVIEVHGIQHYRSSFGGRTLEDEQKNDKLKKELAYQNGVEHYIVIDARLSKTDWIKSSVLNSKLSELFDLTNVDWEQCNEFATGSLTYEICLLYKDGDPSITDKIGKELGITRGTIVNHLKRGAEFGWCDYDPSRIQSLNGREKSKLKSKPVICLENGLEFESASECGRISEKVFGVKLSPSKIALVCSGVNKTHKGYSFKFKNPEDVQYPKFLKNELALKICEAKAKDESLLTTDLSKMFNIKQDRVRSYLIKGASMGLCSYNPSLESKKGYTRYLEDKKRNEGLKRVEVFKNGISQGIYNSIKDLIEASMEDFGVNFTQSSVIHACLGKRKSHKGYTFNYIEVEEE